MPCRSHRPWSGLLRGVPAGTAARRSSSAIRVSRSAGPTSRSGGRRRETSLLPARRGSRRRSVLDLVRLVLWCRTHFVAPSPSKVSDPPMKDYTLGIAAQGWPNGRAGRGVSGRGTWRLPVDRDRRRLVGVVAAASVGRRGTRAPRSGRWPRPAPGRRGPGGLRCRARPTPRGLRCGPAASGRPRRGRRARPRCPSSRMTKRLAAVSSTTGASSAGIVMGVASRSVAVLRGCHPKGVGAEHREWTGRHRRRGARARAPGPGRRPGRRDRPGAPHPGGFAAGAPGPARNARAAPSGPGASSITPAPCRSNRAWRSASGRIPTWACRP